MSASLPAPSLTVVVPTFDRRDRLHRVLVALANQTTDRCFDVIVVSDGSTDGTDEYLRSDSVPLALTVISQENAGPATARNAGLLAASTDIVLFVDDDVVPAPDLIEQHLNARLDVPGDVVVIGPMLNPTDVKLTPWVAWEQRQLYKQYDAMARGVYECTFRQFYTGNASVPRQRIIDVGLFDTNYRRSEDVELAYRLQQDGVLFRFAADARGFHYAERSFDSWLSTPFQYGRNDLSSALAGQNWLEEAIPREFRGRNVGVRLLTKSCVYWPRSAPVISRVLRWCGTTRFLPDRLRQPALSGLYNTTYYLGLAAELGSRRRFLEFISGRRSIHQAPRAAVVLEQTLGHVTHSKNLHALLQDDGGIDVSFLDVPFEVAGAAASVPGYGNWTVRAGLRARRLLRRLERTHGIDVIFFHTQVPAILNGRWMRRRPTIVSLDATPRQYDELGDHYGHATSAGPIEAMKMGMHTRCFRRADHIVVWSDWTCEGLVADYGIDRDRITVIAPGVDVDRWAPAESNSGTASPPDEVVRVLFVGGDLDRKGGRHLIEAARLLRADPSLPAFELHLVTRTDVPDEPGVFVHADMMPNSPELISLYHRCDIFCLPTLGDCLPMVLSEAGVARMALISTDVGAIREIVQHDETGLLIPANDIDALVRALDRLLRDPELRVRLAAGADALVRERFDAGVNARRISAILLAASRVEPAK